MNGPLSGLRIIELAGVGPAPMCGMLLADLGADVIVVDRHGSMQSILSPKHDISRRGKRSIAIDLKRPEGAELVLRLLERADALIEGFRPGVTERLGLGPDVCLARNPRLVYGRVTGWGQHGPLAQAAAHDLNFVAITGLLHHTGRADESPSLPATVVGDVGGGALFMALGLVSGILSARATGRGQVIDAAVSDGCAVSGALLQSMRATGIWSDKRGANLLDGAAPWYDTYRCADGKWISVGALEPQFRSLLLQKLGLAGEDVTAAEQDPARWPQLKRRFTDLFLTRTQAQWCALLEGTDACFAPVLDMGGAMEHPHNVARGTFVTVEGLRQPAPAPRFSATVAGIRSGPAQPGQHTSELLLECGFGEMEIGALRESAVVN